MKLERVTLFVKVAEKIWVLLAHGVRRKGAGMTDRELLQEALDALESLQAWPETPENFKRFRAIEALRARLAQPEPAQCDGGQCGIGGYCKECPKTQPDVTETNFGKMPETINMENFVGSGKPLVPVCWMNANDIDKTDWKVWAHGKPTVSMPLFTVPPQREWVGLTHDEKHSAVWTGGEFGDGMLWAEKLLKERNT